MGEITEMVLEGLLCCRCGSFIDENTGGYPRKCKDCKEESDE